MNITSIKGSRAMIVRNARPRNAPRLTAIWGRSPETGRLEQAWRQADEADGSCTGRPGGPLQLHGARRRLLLAA